MATQISSRELTQYIRELADFKENYQAGRSPNERRPLADVLPERIMGELIPMLKEAYLLMILLSEQWQQKPFQTALANAMETNTLLAGYPAAVYVRLGFFMLAQMDFLDTIGQDGDTAKDVLFADYIPMTPEQWTALNTPPIVPPVIEPDPEPAP